MTPGQGGLNSSPISYQGSNCHTQPGYHQEGPNLTVVCVRVWGGGARRSYCLSGRTEISASYRCVRTKRQRD